MIELNPEQRQAVTQGEAVEIVDPLTHDVYILVQAEVYARLGGNAATIFGATRSRDFPSDAPLAASVLA